VISLRARFILYLVAVHVLAGVLAVYVLAAHRTWILAAEAVFAASLIVGITLVARLFRSLRFIGDSAQLLADSDFTARFVEVGQPEVDRLIHVYNQMIDHLRLERQRVQEQRYFLSHVIDVTPSGMLVLDFDGRIELCNPAALRLSERSEGELRGRRPGETGAPLVDALARLAPGEARVLAASGGRRVRAVAGTFTDRGFTRTFYLLEELTEELRQSEKAAYEKLIRMMSHEVNNSVGASGSLLESSLSYASQLAPGDRADFSRALRIAIDRMAQLNVFMRSFADVVRLPAPVRQLVDVAEMLGRIEGLVREELARRRIAWRSETHAPAPLLSFDPVQMEQAVLNIVKNAIEAVDHDGTITVRLQPDGAALMLTVEDSGPGIPSDVRDQLFTPFFTTKPHGQGIGLTIIREILVNHGFDFSLDAAPGGPTRFTIRFPIRTAEGGMPNGQDAE
jgi:signal transduction histidine kinase